MDKRELNQNGLADETVRDESPVSLPDETPKIQKKRRPKKRPLQSADSSVPKSDAADKREPVTSDTGISESTPKKKRRPVSAEEAPKKKRRPVSAEGAPQKKGRPESVGGLEGTVLLNQRRKSKMDRRGNMVQEEPSLPVHFVVEC